MRAQSTFLAIALAAAASLFPTASLAQTASSPPLPAPAAPSQAPGAAPEGDAPAFIPGAVGVPADGTPSAPSSSPRAPGDQGALPPAPAPPPYVYAPAPPGKHAPHTALWLGARGGILAYGGAFFDNSINQQETSGNFVGAGPSIEANIGVRLNHRYIPYVLAEYAALPAGHRFDSGATSAHSTLYGVGFQFLIGNVDKIGFLADLSLAQRTISLVQGSDRYDMKAPEIFRLALGAEIRLSTLMSISPTATLSGGTMQSSKGTVAYAPGQLDGQTQPTYSGGNIADSQRSYLVVGIGCGVHFDVFGK